MEAVLVFSETVHRALPVTGAHRQLRDAAGERDVLRVVFEDEAQALPLSLQLLGTEQGLIGRDVSRKPASSLSTSSSACSRMAASAAISRRQVSGS